MAFNAADDRDLTIGYRDGGVLDGAPTYTGSPLPLTCIVGNYRDQIRNNARALPARCDNLVKSKLGRTTREITFDALIDKAVGRVLAPLKGRYIELTVTDYTTGTAETIADLAIDDYDFDSSRDDYLRESVKLIPHI